MSEALVAVEALTKSFAPEGPAALDNLTATIAGGQVTGLVGPDGAGKTTFMRLMAGLLAPTSGRLTVCGLDPLRDPSALHRIVGYMPQRFGLYEDLTVLENLALYADLQGVAGGMKARAFERLLGFTGLAPFTSRLAGRLSGGMKQKLGLACALLSSPRLLLLDEPSVGVDPISRRELWRMVHDLVHEGIGVIWSTAYLDEAEHCAKVIVLNEGRALFSGDPKSMTERMTGRVFLVRGDDRRALLARAMQRPGLIDGVLQGASVRLVVGEGEPPPSPEELSPGFAQEIPAPEIPAQEIPAPIILAAPPRFEDAFVASLGRKGHLNHVHDLGLNQSQSKVMDAVDSKSLARDAGGKPSSPHPAPTPRVEAASRKGQGSDFAVEAMGLTKKFGTFTAAEAISFTIARGEIFGLLGPNGAGKSTTFKMMCGLLQPTSGTALVDGHDLYRASAKARGRLGYMAQKFSLYGDLSVAQNLDFFAGIYGLSGRRRRERIAHMIALFDLEPRLAGNAALLPLGFKQRLALACAILHEPPVLFLDEPTSGIDPLTRREFWGLINAMVAGGVTVMVTTHFMEEAEYCDRVALVYRGKTIAIDTPDALQDRVRTSDLPHPTLEDAFIALIEAQDEQDKKGAA
jgi:ABC-2 type transport system ATP-binding protein